MSILNTLIFDRTIDDVRRLQELKRKFMSTGLDDEELREYMNDRAGMKGAYNASDLNRVGEALGYIAGRMRSAADDIAEIVRRHGHEQFSWAFFFGVEHNPSAARITPRNNWRIEDIPRLGQITRLLDDLRGIRQQLNMPATAPPVPASLDGMNYATANDIERLLFEMDIRLSAVEANITDVKGRFGAEFRYTGVTFCGE